MVNPGVLVRCRLRLNDRLNLRERLRLRDEASVHSEHGWRSLDGAGWDLGRSVRSTLIDQVQLVLIKQIVLI